MSAFQHTLILNQNTQTVSLNGEELFIHGLLLDGRTERALLKRLDIYSFAACGRKFRVYTPTADKTLADIETNMNINRKECHELALKILTVLTRAEKEPDILNISFIPEDLSKEEFNALRYAEISALKRNNPDKYRQHQMYDAIFRYVIDNVHGTACENPDNLPIRAYLEEYYFRDATYSQPFLTLDEISALNRASLFTQEGIDKVKETLGIVLNVPDTLRADMQKQPEQPPQPENKPEQQQPPEEKPPAPLSAEEEAVDRLLHPEKYRRPRKKIKYDSRLNDGYKYEPALFKAYLAELLDSLIINDSDDYPIFRANAGRPELPIHDKLFCNIDRINSGIASRLYPESDNVRVALADGYITQCASYNSLTNFLANPKTTPILRSLLQISASPMAIYETQAAVDSSGFRTLTYGEWYTLKYDRELHKTLNVLKKKELIEEVKQEIKLMKRAKMQIWKKAHIIVGAKTGVIISMIVTDSSGKNTADTTLFRPLLEDATKYFDVKECTADKAYGNRKNYSMAKKYGLKIYIPFKSNVSSKPKGVQEWSDMYYLAKEQPEEFYKHYCMRNNVESTFGAIKKALGEEIRARDKTGQINELYCKAIAYNIRRIAILSSVYSGTELFVKEEITV